MEKIKNKNAILYIVLAIIIICGFFYLSSTGLKNRANQAQISQSIYSSGVYTGVLPCADCTGIKKTISLNEDKTFVSTSIHEGKGFFVEKGTWILGADNVFVLTEVDKDGQATNLRQYYLLKADGSLAMVGEDKKEVEGDLASHYILKKTEILSGDSLKGIYREYPQGEGYQQNLVITNISGDEYSVDINFSGATKGCTFKGKAERVNNVLVAKLSDSQKDMKGTMLVDLYPDKASVFTADFEDRFELNYFCGGGASLAGDYMKN